MNLHLTRRGALAAAGVMTLCLVWAGPLPRLAADTFSAHMAMHVLVVAVAAPLLALAVAGGPRDPVARHAQWFSPAWTSLLEFVVIWAWHAPLLHHLSRHHGSAMALEQGSFLLTSFAVWLAAMGGVGVQRDARALAGVGGLLMTSMHMTLLGTLLTLGTRPLYAHGEANALGLGAMADQQFGGLLMLLGAGTVYLLGALALLAAVLQRRRLAA